MKRLTRKQKARLIWAQKNALTRQRKTRRLIAKKQGKRRRSLLRNRIRNHVPALTYKAPIIVSIDKPEYRQDVLRFLSQLRDHFKKHPTRTMVIDFSGTTHFIAGGTLLFFAELNRLLAFSGHAVKLRCKEPRNERASQVLQQIGVYRLCAHHSTVKPSRGDVVHWHVIQGTVVDNSLCAPAIEGFQDRLDAEMIDELLGGLGEAMTNVIHHAYDDLREDGLAYRGETDWWMFSQAKDGFLTVVFCDLGVGIPTTLPLKRPALWARLLLLAPDPTDAQCIKEAIVEGRTSTGLEGRGYGLGNIVEVVEKMPGAFVHVYSNRGRYASHDGQSKIVNYDDSILGTLIIWKVPLRAVVDRSKT